MGVQLLAYHVVGEDIPVTLFYDYLPHVSHENVLWCDPTQGRNHFYQATVVALMQMDASKKRKRCPRSETLCTATKEERENRGKNYMCCASCVTEREP